MKIVQILHYPGQGGAEEVMYLLAKEAKEDGQEVEFVFGGKGPFVKKVEELGCSVNFIKMRSPFDVIAIWQMRKLFKKIKPDIIHTHFLRENFIAIAAGRKYGIKSIFSTVHRIEPKNFIQKFFNRLYSRGLSSFIAPSRAVEEYLLKEGIKPDKIKLVYNGIDIPEGKGVKWPSDFFTVGFVGRLSPVKNVSLLLDAIAAIKKKDKMRAFIVGDGPERMDLEKKARRLGIEGVVYFEGYVENPKAYYQKFDVLVLPSKREALGMVALEACSRGVPVIASRTGGITEVIKDEVNGLLFDNESLDDLVSQIERLKEDVDFRRVLAKNAPESVKKFSSKNMYRELKGLYTASFGQSKGQGL